MTIEYYEQTTPILIGKLVDENGSAIAGSSLDSFTVTLYDKVTGSVINSRNQTNIKANVGEDGVFSWQLDKNDTVIVQNHLRREAHIALFEWRWGGTKYGKLPLQMSVVNLEKVT